MNMILLILLHSLIYSFVLSSGLSLSQFSEPRIWLQCYPKGIQQAVPDKDRREKISTLIHGIPFLLFMFLYPPITAFFILDDPTILMVFLSLFCMMFSFNLVDLVILDWLIFNHINPDYLTLPGTKGMREYKDYYFHVKGFYTGTLLTVVFGLIYTVILYFFI